jgi:hypothetical protein
MGTVADEGTNFLPYLMNDDFPFNPSIGKNAPSNQVHVWVIIIIICL